ncbi:MAG: pyridine nucleotide-disulfide oxidoreductase, partial [Chloroflexota bacterium]|nr:pyridine nucleotide-disulfide oxidoreductase [Chloroflexota bacterium]
DTRIASGFGGVAEYGITVRWDKNFLKLIHLTLMRRKAFKAFGGVRFGGTLRLEDAWAAGFHHVALAAGAGRPTVLDIKGNLLPGIRAASDFLMALQLTGAFKKSSLANLTLRLPVVVVGGGLTAVDACTEALAYYPVQVEKALETFERLTAERPESEVWEAFSLQEREILEEQLQHGRAIRAERERAGAAGEAPHFLPLLQAWGGVTLCYRKRLQDSPAYRVNHEEVQEFLAEGVRVLECVEPQQAIPDEWGSVAELVLEKTWEAAPGRWEGTGERTSVRARSVLVVAGTSPNVIYEKEHPGTFQLDGRGRFFQPHRRQDGRLVPAGGTLADPGFFTSYSRDGHYVSFYGDNHPAYAGSVVKAMASAKHGHRALVQLFEHERWALRPAGQHARWSRWNELIEELDRNLLATVQRVERLTANIVEITVRAPYQARGFRPGQFYRLQNFEVDAPLVQGRRLQMEGVALTGAWVNHAEGTLGLIVLESGASSRLCSSLEPGERIVLMGPTGAPTEIGSRKNVLLAGGGLGNAVLFSLAGELRARDNRVVYFAAYRTRDDVFHRDDIEAGCQQVIWSVESGELIEPRRPRDRTFLGNIVDAMLAYDRGQLGEVLFPFSDMDQMIAIGSHRMMAAVSATRHTE